MADSGKVQCDLNEGMANIRFSHPKANSLPAALLDDLLAAVKDFAANPKARVICLSSPGNTFCAGASFDEFERLSSVEEATAFFARFAKLFLAMRDAPKWVLARAQGKAVGGGVGLLAASDYALGCEQAAVCLSEYALDIGPYVIGPAIERRIGPSAFRAMALDCQWRDERWCLEHGLLDASCSSIVTLDVQVEEMMRTLAGRDAEATRVLKQTAWQGSEDWKERFEQRAQLSAQLLIKKRERK